MNEHYGYILLSDVKWWNKLCERRERKFNSFVRRNKVGPLETKKLLFYVKRPLMQLRGVADFLERLTGDYKELWRSYGAETCLKSFHEYINFLKGRRTVTFIRFTNFRELENPVPVNVLRNILVVKRMPQGGKYVDEETVKVLVGE